MIGGSLGGALESAATGVSTVERRCSKSVRKRAQKHMGGSMRKRFTAIVVALLTLAVPVIARAQSSQPNATYTWLAEFVSVDSAARTITVKPRVAYQEAMSELKQFKPGESVWVVWSGIQDYSEAIRQVRRAEAGHKIDDHLVLPAEFVSSEAPQQYVKIRVKVPEKSIATIQSLKPGEWVTVTSRDRPSTDADAVVTVMPYGSNTSARVN
jgi:hypothetical protein